MSSPYVCVGQIVGVHGVRGLVKLKSFTAVAADVVAYGPLSDETGKRRFKISLNGPTPGGQAKGMFLARVDGVADRTTAETLAGIKLYVARSMLPEPEDEDEFYYADLVGLRAEMADGTLFGTVLAVHEYGAGDTLELRKTDGRTAWLPFTRLAVPVVDVKGGRIVVDPPVEIEVRDDGVREDAGGGDAEGDWEVVEGEPG